MNLLKETLGVMEEHGIAPPDVYFVVCRDQLGSWDDFSALADFDYDNSYGGTEISLNLHIVGKDWWLSRREYDGSQGGILSLGRVGQ